MSLYGMMRTGVSGMNAQSTRLATVADNIANSGTNGYKRASVEFSSLVIPNTGTNYVSGGVQTQIRYAISQAGPLQYTTSVFDLAMKGNGFFIAGDSNGSPNLTRAGSFVPDANGYLVNAAGFKLMGYDYANGIPSAVANGYAGLVPIKLEGGTMTAVASTYGSIKANVPYTAPHIAGHRPSSNPPTAAQVTQGMENGSIHKSSIMAIGNAGEEILLDVYFARTSLTDPSGIAVNANDPLISGYTLPSTSIPPAPILHANNPVVSAYSAPSTNIADAASNSFTFGGFSGLPWSVGDTTAFTIDIGGTAVHVSGTYDGSTWTFAPDNPAAIPAGVGISYDTSGGDLVIDIDNASGGPVAVGVDGFVSHTYYDDLSVAFPGFSSLYWDDEDTVSFNVDIDGSVVGITGVFNNGVWSFAPDDPAAVPAGVTIAYDTSGPDLIVNLDNATGSAITAEVGGFSSTTTASADKWEMTVYHQPDATAWSGFPYSDGPLMTISLEFDKTTGSLAASSPLSMQLDLAGLNGGMVEIDVSDMSQLAADFTILDVDVNGSGPATVSDYLISADGTLYAQYENGQMMPLYKLALATVQSPDQMSVLPGNVFQPGINSGSVQIGFAGEGGLGDIISGALENSNVDIAEELTNMIESQRNYTANSKVFQTGSDLMDVLVNLKR